MRTPITAMLRKTVRKVASKGGTFFARSHSVTGRLSTARKSASADGRRIAEAYRSPYTTTTRQASVNRSLAPGFCS